MIHSNEPKDAPSYVERGEYRRWLTDDISGAITDFTEAIRLEPNLAEAYTGRGRALAQVGDYAGAIADHTEAIRLEPNLADAYAGRAAALSHIQDYAGAIADYTEAIRLEPNDDSNYYCRGGVREQQKDYVGAIADYSEAIRLVPKDYNYDYRAEARLKQGDLEGAIADFKKAMDSDQDAWWGWHDKIGTIYASLGDTTNAVAAFKLALALNPPDETRKKDLQEYIEKHSLE